MKDTRAAINQAEVKDSAASILFGEIAIISLIAGVIASSWGVGGGVLLGLIVITWFKRALIALLVILTIIWPIITWIFAASLGAGFGTKLVFSIITLLISAGTHMNAFDWTEDMYREE